MWAAALVLLFIAYVVLSMIPVLSFFLQLLLPFVIAGIAVAADQQRRTGTFELDALVVGFKKKPISLLAVGGAMILVGVVFTGVLAIFIGAEAFGIMLGGQTDPSLFLGARFWLAILIGIAITVPLNFAIYLAPS